MKILKEITPTEFEKKRALAKIDAFLKKLNLNLDVEIGGSFAKDTWLKNNFDVDIFVKFPYEHYKERDISKVLHERLKKAKIVHGSRDYFQIKKGKFVYEFIPVLDIKHAEDAVNITDVSPLHTRWVEKHKDYCDQVRLTKKFCKANGVYGAESHLKGFSGYVLEILTIYYHGFLDLVKNACNWKYNEVTDIEKYYSSKKEVLESLNRDKISPLIVVDPVDKNRNAAAALSNEKFEKFIELCKKFMRNPSDEFFKDKKVDINNLRFNNNGNKLVLFKFKPLLGKKDVVGNKVLKAFAYINDRIEEEGFDVKGSDIDFGDNLFWYYIKNEILSEYVKHYGPPVKEEKHMELFKKKWEGNEIYNDGVKVFVRVKRKYKDIKSLVKDLIKEPYVKENIRNLKFKIY